eukprot:5547349-Amphidinium_carterae.1
MNGAAETERTIFRADLCQYKSTRVHLAALAKQMIASYCGRRERGVTNKGSTTLKCVQRV